MGLVGREEVQEDDTREDGKKGKKKKREQVFISGISRFEDKQIK